MLPINRILHATDCTPGSEPIFRFACALAEDYGAELTVLHVLHNHKFGLDHINPPSEAERLAEARQKLRRFQALDTPVVVHHRFEEGNPADAILKVADELQVRLLVIGTHGRTGLARLLMGSVAEEVVRRAECPVITVKTSKFEAEPIPSRESPFWAEEAVPAGTALHRWLQ